MNRIARIALILLSATLWILSLLVFLTGMPLLVNRSLSPIEGACGMLFYTLISLGLVHVGWRIMTAARRIPLAYTPHQ